MGCKCQYLKPVNEEEISKDEITKKSYNINTSAKTQSDIISSKYKKNNNNNIKDINNINNNNNNNINQNIKLKSTRNINKQNNNTNTNSMINTNIISENNNNNINNNFNNLNDFVNNMQHQIVNNIGNNNNISNNISKNIYIDNSNNFEAIKSSLPQIQLNYNNKLLDPNLLPEDDFSKYIFENINKIRTNPQSYINIIEDSKQKITIDKYNRLIYKSKVKVTLSKGNEAFDEAINYLREIEPMNKLIYNPNLNIKLPNEEKEIKDKNYLKNQVSLLISRGLNIKSFWRDSIKDPETSFILMIVDDKGINSGMKRKDILDRNMKYIGINSTFIGKSFVCYMLFSDQ